MKKLLLLALLPLALSGCSDFESSKKDFGWKEVKPGESITVYFGSGSSSQSYYNSEGGTLKYKLVTYETVTELSVHQTWANLTNEINDYYIGTNITLYYDAV